MKSKEFPTEHGLKDIYYNPKTIYQSIEKL